MQNIKHQEVVLEVVTAFGGHAPFLIGGWGCSRDGVSGQADLALLGIEMKVIFVRHGEPDYQRSQRSVLILAFGLDFMPLSE